MQNLLDETIEKLKDYGKTLDDIVWFGNGKFRIDDDIKDFLNVDYDSGYGGQEIACDLLLVGKDFWLERHEYDGSEWWEFKRFPNMPEMTIKNAKIIGDWSWCGLGKINNI